MSKTTKFLRKTINLGKTNSKARILSEQFLESKGQQKFSGLIRHLIITYFSNKPELQKDRIRILKSEHKQIKEKIAELHKQKFRIEEKLEKDGVKIKEGVIV